MKILLSFCVILLLAGCSVPRSEIRTVVVNQCPVLQNYTPEQQKIAAQELRKLYTDSQLAIMITDYSKLRDACRIVNKRVRVKSRKIVK